MRANFHRVVPCRLDLARVLTTTAALLALAGCTSTTPDGDWIGEADCPPSNEDPTIRFSLTEADEDLARGDGNVRWDAPDGSGERWHFEFDVTLRIDLDEADSDDVEQIDAEYNDCVGPYATREWPCPLDGGMTWSVTSDRLGGRMLLPALFDDYVGWFECSFDLDRPDDS